MWNPFRTRREERAKDRETLLAALDKIFEAQSRQAEVAIEQSKAMRTFLNSFMVASGAPISRVSTDESEYETERLSWGVIGES